MLTKKRSLPELSVDTQVLAKRLLALELNELILYDELTEIVGRDVRHQPVNGLLRSARYIVLRDAHIVTEAVRGEGIKRLDDEGIAQLGDQHIARIRRASRRTAMRCAATQRSTASRRASQRRCSAPHGYATLSKGESLCLRRNALRLIAARREAARRHASLRNDSAPILLRRRSATPLVATQHLPQASSPRHHCSAHRSSSPRDAMPR